jgi:hypothetical protein
MKKILLLSLILFVSCKCTQPIQYEISYKKEYDSLLVILKEQEIEIDVMKDELQFKESEISYWGRKFDSCSVSNKHKK